MKKMNLFLTMVAMTGMLALTGCDVTISTGNPNIPVKALTQENVPAEEEATASTTPAAEIIEEETVTSEPEETEYEESTEYEECAEVTDWSQTLDPNKEWMFILSKAEELAYSFELTTDETDYLTYGTFVCQGSNGTYWEYKTGKHELGQNYTIEFICEAEDCFYINDGGTIVALDLWDGHVIWENDDYQGGGSTSVFDDDGNMYISGYEYPALMVIDPSGNTLLYVEQFADYYWTRDMVIEDSVLTIYYDGHEGAGVQMDIRDYSYTIF